MSKEKNINEGTCRACWQNCGVQADAEMLDIDKMEDAIAPLAGSINGQDHKIAIVGPIRFLAGFQLKHRPRWQQTSRHNLSSQEHP